jgi:ABC-type transport system substrate-binding protein
VFNAEEWVPREVVVYDAFEDYFRGPPAIKRIEARVIKDENTRAMALHSGEVHIASFQDPAVYGEYVSADNLNGYSIEEVHVAKLDLNTQNPPLDNVKVRRAVAHAIDTRGLIESVLEGQALRPNCNFLHPKMANVNSEPFKPFEYDPELSRKLLAEVDLMPEDIHLEGVTYGSSLYAKAAEFLNLSFQNAGLDITIQPLERGALHSQRASPDNHMVIIAHPRWPDPDPFLVLIHGSAIPPNGINFTWWDNGDELIDRSRSTSGKQRTEVLTELQELLCKEVPQVPLWHRQSFYLVNRNVEGFTPGPGAYFFPFELSFKD